MGLVPGWFHSEAVLQEAKIKETGEMGMGNAYFAILFFCLRLVFLQAIATPTKKPFVCFAY